MGGISNGHPEDLRPIETLIRPPPQCRIVLGEASRDCGYVSRHALRGGWLAPLPFERILRTTTTGQPQTGGSDCSCSAWIPGTRLARCPPVTVVGSVPVKAMVAAYLSGNSEILTPDIPQHGRTWRLHEADPKFCCQQILSPTNAWRPSDPCTNALARRLKRMRRC